MPLVKLVRAVLTGSEEPVPAPKAAKACSHLPNCRPSHEVVFLSLDPSHGNPSQPDHEHKTGDQYQVIEEVHGSMMGTYVLEHDKSEAYRRSGPFLTPSMPNSNAGFLDVFALSRQCIPKPVDAASSPLPIAAAGPRTQVFENRGAFFKPSRTLADRFFLSQHDEKEVHHPPCRMHQHPDRVVAFTHPQPVCR